MKLIGLDLGYRRPAVAAKTVAQWDVAMHHDLS